MSDCTGPSAVAQALAQSARFLARCSELAGVGAWEWHPASGQLVVSDAACELLALPAGRVPTLEALLAAFGADGTAMLDAALQRAAETGQGWDVELPAARQRVLRVVGRVDDRDAAHDAAAPVDDDGRRVSVVLLDVTEPAGVRAELERALDRLDLATHSGGVGVWDLDLSAGTLVWDDVMWRLHGDTPRAQPLAGRDWWARLAAPARRGVVRCWRAARRRGQPLEAEWAQAGADGADRVLHGAGRVLRDAGGRPLRVTGVCWDVTEPRRLQQQLQAQRELLATTLQSIGDAVLTTDAHGRITGLNPVAERLTGWPLAEALGQPVARVFVTELPEPTTDAQAEHPVRACLRRGQPVQHTPGATLVARDGRRCAVEDSVAPIRHGPGPVQGAVLVFRDVTRQRHQLDEIRWRASHDGLTGLVNRQEFAQRLKRAAERSRRDGSRHAVLALDLDHFKQINDHCGHAAGDAVLKEVARRLEAGVRSRDTLARLGGDEFAALLENCSLDEAERVARLLCARVAEVAHQQGDRRWGVGASIGLAGLDADTAEAELALRDADAACLQAKARGRNQVRVSRGGAERRPGAAGVPDGVQLQRAVARGALSLDSQRVVPLAPVPPSQLQPQLQPQPMFASTRELLLRWRDDAGVRRLPGTFLGAAARAQLLPALDVWVLRQAVARLLQAPPGGGEALSLNWAVATLVSREGGEALHDAAQALGPGRAKALCLEVSAAAVGDSVGGAVGDAMNAVRPVLQRWRAAGGRVALDDAGARGPVFELLRALPLDEVKIDAATVQRGGAADAHALDRLALRTVVEAAQAMGLRAVAKGVERREMLPVLAALGVHAAQGFALHRPEPLG